MNRLPTLILSLLMGLILITATQVAAQVAADKEAVLWAAEDLKWVPMQGGAPGAMNVTLWGDQTKGQYAGFVKFPAGVKTPMHSHTNDVRMVVIKGAYTYKGKIYGPGSYVFIPGGDKHESGGVENSETILFIEQPGMFDLKMAELPKATK